MDIYKYHLDTKEYLGQEEAILNPRSPGNFIKPAQSTFTAPDDIDINEISVIDEATDTWSVEPDFRGQTQYNITDASQSSNIITIGSVPAGFTLLVPGYPTDTWTGSAWVSSASAMQNVKIAEVKELANSKILANYPTWKQININMKMNELIRKEALGTITGPETTELNQIETDWKLNVTDIRDASDLIEAELLALTVDTDIDSYNVNTNLLWP